MEGDASKEKVRRTEGFSKESHSSDDEKMLSASTAPRKIPLDRRNDNNIIGAENTNNQGIQDI